MKAGSTARASLAPMANGPGLVRSPTAKRNWLPKWAPRSSAVGRALWSGQSTIPPPTCGHGCNGSRMTRVWSCKRQHKRSEPLISSLAGSTARKKARRANEHPHSQDRGHGGFLARQSHAQNPADWPMVGAAGFKPGHRVEFRFDEPGKLTLCFSEPERSSKESNTD